MSPRAAAMSLRAYAKHRRDRGLPGGTLSAVQKAIEAGRIKRTRDGLINAAAADAAWKAVTDETRATGGLSEPGGIASPAVLPQPDARPRAAPISSPATAPSSPPGAIPEYRTSRAKREAIAASREALLLKKLAGSLVEVTDVKAEAFAAGREVRLGVRAAHSRLASILAAETDPATIERMLNHEVDVVFLQFAGEEGAEPGS